MMTKNVLFSLCVAIGLCLQLDLRSQQTIGVFQNDSLSQNGYTLFTAATHTYLMDNCGRVINQWSHNTNPGLACYLTDEGTLLRAGNQNGVFTGGGVGGRLEEYSWEGDLIWSYSYASAEHHQHHDLEPLPNGNFLLIAWEGKTSAESTANGANNGASYSPLKVVEIEPSGTNEINEVWAWHVWDHLIQDHEPAAANYGVVGDHPELVDINAYPPSGGFAGGDWQHANGVDYNEDRDEIALSIKDFGEIWVIDHSTTTAEAASHQGGNQGRGGDLLYRWGNPQVYDRGDDSAQILHGQHDVKWIPEGHPHAGGFSVFNNGIGQVGQDFSTVDIIIPPYDGNGNYLQPGPSETFGPDDVEWSYAADPPESMFSQNQGGAQAQPNGNMLITVTTQGRSLEVTMDGQVVWYYGHTIAGGGPIAQGQVWGNTGGSSFRFERYLSDHPALVGKDLTPGDVIELNPLPFDCEIYEPVSLQEQQLLRHFYTNYRSASQELELFNRGTEAVSYILYDLTGRLITQGQLTNDSVILDLYGQADGAYVIHVQGQKTGHVLSKKFIKY